jgi:hypothetical protein
MAKVASASRVIKPTPCLVAYSPMRGVCSGSGARQQVGGSVKP